MANDISKNKVNNALKFSSIGEILARILTPLVNMILARLLAPEYFGVITTINMIISFVDMFSDAGFQKYIVQHNFKNDDSKILALNVAFWSNLSLSIFLWIIIIVFRDSIATMLGNEGLGNAIAIACLQLVISSFSSIQTANYRRELNYKVIFKSRIASSIVPFFITIPLAYLDFKYWSLIMGNTIALLINAIILNYYSDWRPKLVFNFNILKEMLSYGIWTLLDSVTSWLSTWVDVLIIGSTFSGYYLGLYKNSLNMVNSLMAIVTASVLPILFATLSRMQNDDEKFQRTYFNMQKMVAYLIFPMGVGVFIYRSLATDLMFGEGWEEASNIVGSWALILVIGIVYSNFNGEVYRAKGAPKISFIYQITHLLFLIPVLIYSRSLGFWPLVYSRILIRLQGAITGFIFMKLFMKFEIKDMLFNLNKPLLCTLLMYLLSLLLKPLETSIVHSFINILLLILAYVISLRFVSKNDYDAFLGLVKGTFISRINKLGVKNGK
ncbi:lipopolysaccharide biosynthesis protein [Carnobacterium sp. 1290_CSPC]|uniref:lipopolysaccharide biosynthesis protein n=1 Tax=Carnobacterium sp. 1290_CSPC TaxID=1579347 RepID=UPI00080A8415|nr:lipopolysaccharide biosynthesis protein [Carnobacterium sp. 1290_CSPC]